MQLIYRQATAADAPSLIQLVARSWQRFEQLLGPDHWGEHHRALGNVNYQTLADTTYGQLCESVKGEIAGMAFLVPSGNAKEIFPSDWCYVRMVTVHPDYHGMGIGRELMRRCIEYARDSGERTMGLHTSEMMNAARHIYESMGFSIQHELGHRFGKRYWLYRLDL